MNNGTARAISSIGDYALLILRVIGVTLRRPPSLRQIRDQLFEIGVLSLPVVAITGLFTGMVLAAQTYYQLNDKGLSGAIGLMTTKAMMVELGPVLTAFMITGRVGAAMCAELGTMRVTEQIDALLSMAVNPLRYLVAPRFIGGIIALPLLTVFSSMMGILGGYVIAVYYYGLPSNVFLDPLPTNITVFDFISGLVKAFCFGFIIVTISCYKGMRTRGGAAGVGRATTNSVVICYSVILICNFLLTVGLNSANTYLHLLYARWLA
jgi:phospholipid/cholesterol/gamma-HCH transport system permease protein